MFATFLAFIKKVWLSWAGLFSAIPYGNPYLASAVLFLLLCIAIVLFQEIEWRLRSSKARTPDDEWISTWCKVRNYK